MTTTWSTGLKILRSLDYTANCTLAIKWHEVQRPSWVTDGTIGTGNDSVNIDFMSSAWPIRGQLIKNEIADFYDEVSAFNPESWIQRAFTQIEISCLAPLLANRVPFQALSLESNCQSTADFFVNKICVINPETLAQNQSTAKLDLASLKGLEMIRNTWPYNSSIHTDSELMAWAYIVEPESISFMNGPQSASICLACKVQFCKSASLTGNPDVAGIGVMISYTTECFLVTASAIYRGLASRCSPNSRLMRYTDIADETNKVLISSVLFFELFLAIASLASLNKFNSFYESQITEHAIILTSFALVVTIFVTPRPKIVARANILLLWIAAILTFAMVEYTLLDLWVRRIETYGDALCTGVPSSVNGAKAWAIAIQIIPASAFAVLLWYSIAQSSRNSCIKLLHMLCLCNWLFFSGHRNQLLDCTSRNGDCLLPVLKKIACLVLVLVLLTLMWAVMLVMWVIRFNTQKLGGPSWIENSFGFGQILALLVWAPVVIVWFILMSKSSQRLSLADWKVPKSLELMYQLVHKYGTPVTEHPNDENLELLGIGNEPPIQA